MPMIPAEHGQFQQCLHYEIVSLNIGASTCFILAVYSKHVVLANIFIVLIISFLRAS